MKRVKNLHTADCLRANKSVSPYLLYSAGASILPKHGADWLCPCFRSTMAWGLEARVPFLDKTFLDVAMNIDAEHKMFSKGQDQEVDADGCPKMEKVTFLQSILYTC